MKKVAISVIMPTFNSARTISCSLQSIRMQKFQQDQIEILVVDGGSTDETKKIAKKFNCIILDNPHIQQEYAKNIGLRYCNGRCIVFLDSDEVLNNTNSFSIKYNLITKGASIIFSGGYKSPPQYPLINEYINSFGDPFAYFMYCIQFDEGNYITDMQKKYANVNFEEYVKFVLKDNSNYPLIDLCAGTTIDKNYLKNNIPDALVDASYIPKIPYMILSKTNCFFIIKNDGVLHYSAETIKKYINKLNWRIVVNFFYKTIPGTGYTNREKFLAKSFQLKKYLFIPFAISFIGPVFVSIYLFFKKGKKSIIYHPFLTFYVAIKIIYYFFLKSINKKPNLMIYGN